MKQKATSLILTYALVANLVTACGTKSFKVPAADGSRVPSMAASRNDYLSEAQAENSNQAGLERGARNTENSATYKVTDNSAHSDTDNNTENDTDNEPEGAEPETPGTIEVADLGVQYTLGEGRSSGRMGFVVAEPQGRRPAEEPKGNIISEFGSAVKGAIDSWFSEADSVPSGEANQKETLSLANPAAPSAPTAPKNATVARTGDAVVEQQNGIVKVVTDAGAETLTETRVEPPLGTDLPLAKGLPLTTEAYELRKETGKRGAELSPLAQSVAPKKEGDPKVTTKEYSDRQAMELDVANGRALLHTVATRESADTAVQRANLSTALETARLEHNTAVKGLYESSPDLREVAKGAGTQGQLKTLEGSPEGGRVRDALGYVRYAETKLTTIADNKEARQDLVDFAKLNIAIADEGFAVGQATIGEHHLSLARIALDTALDFTPGVSLAKDLAYLATGKNLITGETLTNVDKALIVGGLFAPAIIGGAAKKSVRYAVAKLEKAAHLQSEAGSMARRLLAYVTNSDATLKKFTKHAPCVTDTSFRFQGPVWFVERLVFGVQIAEASDCDIKLGEITDEAINGLGDETAKRAAHFSDSAVVRTTEAVNQEARARRWNDPWGLTKNVIEGELKEAKTLYRVTSANGKEGQWLVDFNPKDMGMSKAEFNDLLALPATNNADKIFVLTAAPGARLRVGVAGPQPEWGGKGGAVQWQIIEDDVLGPNFKWAAPTPW